MQKVLVLAAFSVVATMGSSAMAADWDINVKVVDAKRYVPAKGNYDDKYARATVKIEMTALKDGLIGGVGGSTFTLKTADGDEIKSPPFFNSVQELGVKDATAPLKKGTVKTGEVFVSLYSIVPSDKEYTLVSVIKGQQVTTKFKFKLSEDELAVEPWEITAKAKQSAN